jgi:hypothetical protein
MTFSCYLTFPLPEIALAPIGEDMRADDHAGGSAVVNCPDLPMIEIPNAGYMNLPFPVLGISIIGRLCTFDENMLICSHSSFFFTLVRWFERLSYPASDCDCEIFVIASYIFFVPSDLLVPVFAWFFRS